MVAGIVSNTAYPGCWWRSRMRFAAQYYGMAMNPIFGDDPLAMLCHAAFRFGAVWQHIGSGRQFFIYQAFAGIELRSERLNCQSIAGAASQKFPLDAARHLKMRPDVALQLRALPPMSVGRRE